jgi:hypothetical protein
MYYPMNDSYARQQQLQQQFMQRQQQAQNPQDLPENQLPAPLPVQSGTGMPEQMAQLAQRQRVMQGSGRFKPVAMNPMQPNFNEEVY